MKDTRSCFQVVTTFAVLALLFVGNANAQTAANRKALLNRSRTLINKIPAQHQKLLSSGMQRILQLAQVLNDDHSKMVGDGGTITISPKVGAANALTSAVAQFAPIPGPGLRGFRRLGVRLRYSSL